MRSGLGIAGIAGEVRAREAGAGIACGQIVVGAERRYVDMVSPR